MNLARGLYRDADIYLLDDPLSAVDAKVSKHLFEKYNYSHCHYDILFKLSFRSIKTYLRDKVCILVTHQIQFLRYATKILVLDNVCFQRMFDFDIK